MRENFLNQTTSKTAIIFAILVLLLTLTLKGQSGNLHPNGTGKEAIQTNTPPFETSMERGRYAQVVSLATEGDFDVTEFRQFLKPDIAWYNGRFMSTFPPGVAVLATPLYLVGRLFNLSQVFTFATSALFSVLTAFFVYKTAIKLKLSKQAGLIGAVTFALGSVAWPYSVSFSAHPVSAFITILGTYFLADLLIEEKNSARNLGIIGLLAGVNFVIDYPNILIFAPIAITAFFYKAFKIEKDGDYLNIEHHLVKKIPLVVGFAIALIPFVLFNLQYFQKPIAFTNTYTIKFLETEGVNFEDIELTNKIFENRDYATRFSAVQTLNGIKTLLVSSDRGLLFFSPVFIFALAGIYYGFKKYKLWTLTAVSCFALNVLIYGSYDDPWGGWAFGPRYLIVTLPLLCIFCAEAFESLVARFGMLVKVAFFVLLAFGSGVALLGALTTNAVPPSIEVGNSGTPTNFVHNWNYLHDSGVNAFVNNVFANLLTNQQSYYFVLLATVILLEFYIIFVYRNSKESKQAKN